jgi:hypothetical protein
MLRYMKIYHAIEMFLNSACQKVKDIHMHIKVIGEEKHLHAVSLSNEVLNKLLFTKYN